LTDPRDTVPHSHRVVHTADVDGQCNKLITDERHQFITLTFHLQLYVDSTWDNRRDNYLQPFQRDGWFPPKFKWFT